MFEAAPEVIGMLATDTEPHVALDAGRHRAEVPAGDSAWFDATLPHSYANPDTIPATFTLVVFEPA